MWGSSFHDVTRRGAFGCHERSESGLMGVQRDYDYPPAWQNKEPFYNFPSSYDRKKAETSKQLQMRIELVKLRGPKNSDDMLLLWKIDTGKIYQNSSGEWVDTDPEVKRSMERAHVPPKAGPLFMIDIVPACQKPPHASLDSYEEATAPSIEDLMQELPCLMDEKTNTLLYVC